MHSDLLTVSRGAGLGNYFKYQQENFPYVLCQYFPPSSVLLSSPLMLLSLSTSLASASVPQALPRAVTKTSPLTVR